VGFCRPIQLLIPIKSADSMIAPEDIQPSLPRPCLPVEAHIQLFICHPVQRKNVDVVQDTFVRRRMKHSQGRGYRRRYVSQIDLGNPRRYLSSHQIIQSLRRPSVHRWTQFHDCAPCAPDDVLAIHDSHKRHAVSLSRFRQDIYDNEIPTASYGVDVLVRLVISVSVFPIVCLN
jgi:hypothetical protein